MYWGYSFMEKRQGFIAMEKTGWSREIARALSSLTENEGPSHNIEALTL